MSIVLKRDLGLIIMAGMCIVSRALSQSASDSSHYVKSIDKLETCPAKFDDDRPEDLIYRLSSGVRPPKLKNHVSAEFLDQARKAHKEGLLKVGFTVLSLVVDANGMPRNVCVVTPAGFGLDEQAAKAVWQYRFDPARKNGEPVAVRISVNVKFRMS